MKKLALIVLALIAVGMCNTSCNKKQTCSCLMYYQGIPVSSTPTIYDTEIEAVKNCDVIQERLNIKEGGDGYSFKCTAL